MIVAFSTSSPLASVALLEEDGTPIAGHEELAPMRASSACVAALERLLAQQRRSLDQATGFLADLGPGSFTGVRVGVTLAKTFAFAAGRPAGGLPSFDLISPDRAVAVPSRRGRSFVREPGEAPVEAGDDEVGPDLLGYGPSRAVQTHPRALAFGALLPDVAWLDPVALLPLYLAPPSISTPKRPYGLGADA